MLDRTYDSTYANNLSALVAMSNRSTASLASVAVSKRFCTPTSSDATAPGVVASMWPQKNGLPSACLYPEL